MRSLPLVILLLSVSAVAHPQLSTKVEFNVAAAGEGIAEILAAAPGASWDKPGAEAAVATLTLDGEYNQDLFILRGGEPSAYRVFLGPLTPGRHTLEVVRSDRWSAPGANFGVQQVRASVIDPSSPDYRAIAHAPILYARADTLGRFSDAPLLMWYERFPEAGGETIQYSIVFTNEDGGTPTDALMARWGRASDIEYIYRVRFDAAGAIREELYQGPDHADLHFAGRKLGNHPYFLDASLNNIFMDAGYSPVQYRLLPIAADLSGHSREEIMDRNPWTYVVMAQEMAREGRIRGSQQPAKVMVGDPRSYLYLELNADNRNCGSVVWAKIKGDPRWKGSHLGRLDYSVTRSGWFRTTVELPAGAAADNIEAIAYECADIRDPRLPMSGNADSALHSGGKAFLLDREYRPGRNLLADRGEEKVRPGELLMLPLSAQAGAASR